MFDTQPKTDTLSVSHYAFICILLFFAFLWGISSYPISDMNEGLYAEIAREMINLKDFIIPHLNYVPYIEKPPLLYWLLAINYQLFGTSEWSARLVPALSAIGICLGMLWFGKKMNFSKQSWMAAVILSSSFGFIIISRILLFDMLLTACLTFSLLGFYFWYEKSNISTLRFAYIALAFAVLTKGIIAAGIGFLIVISFFLFSKTERKKIIAFFDPIGISLFFLIIVPWHLIAIIQEPEFAWDYIVNEQIMRFFDKRVPHDYHTGPLYFYLPKLMIYCFPWCLAFPLLLFSKNKESNTMHKRLSCFFWCWFLVPLLSFV